MNDTELEMIREMSDAPTFIFIFMIICGFTMAWVYENINSL
jgi:hypothetical protein